MHTIWAVICVGSVAFTVTYAIARLNHWLDERAERKRRHAHPIVISEWRRPK